MTSGSAAKYPRVIGPEYNNRTNCRQPHRLQLVRLQVKGAAVSDHEVHAPWS